MKRNSRFKSQGSITKSTALLWDESYLWGLIAYNALVHAELPFDLVRASDLRNGCLDGYAALFVPGGWASNKMKALGPAGMEAVRTFVQGGGNYIGICGGAGLATMDGIGLAPVKRMPTKERVPSFSGRIRLWLSQHALWNSVTDPVFHVWWPSQFMVAGEAAHVIASYKEPMPDSFSSDLNVGDVQSLGGWSELECAYRINLDPGRMLGFPAVIEAGFGKGKVLLSLVHFDTPGDSVGEVVLRNLWRYVGVDPSEHPNHRNEQQLDLSNLGKGDISDSRGISGLISEIANHVCGLISLGERNFLWFWRNPKLLQWRRGIRGLEYCALYVIASEIVNRADLLADRDIPALEHILNMLAYFVPKAKRLLLLERAALQKGFLTYERCDDPEIQSLRNELFSNTKSHAGLFKELLDQMDGLLYDMLRRL